MCVVLSLCVSGCGLIACVFHVGWLGFVGLICFRLGVGFDVVWCDWLVSV